METLTEIKDRHRKEIKSFQDSCFHENHECVEGYGYNPGIDAAVCTLCGKVISCRVCEDYLKWRPNV